MPFNYLSRNLTLDRLPKGSWRIAEEVSYENGTVTVIVPKGTKTDLASIPDIFKWYVNNDDYRVIRPAIVHDWLYATHKTAGGYISRSQSDDLFYDMLREEGMGVFKARVMWLGVRLGGWIAWDKS